MIEGGDRSRQREIGTRAAPTTFKGFAKLAHPNALPTSSDTLK